MRITGSSKVTTGSSELCEFSLSGCESTKASSRTYHFRAADSDGYKLWVDALKKNIAHAAAAVQQQHDSELNDKSRQRAISEAPAADSVKSLKAHANWAPATRLSGTLLKKSKTFPYPWQSRDVRLEGEHSLMYQTGNGTAKGLSLHEVKVIRMTNPVRCEFEMLTHANRSYVDCDSMGARVTAAYSGKRSSCHRALSARTSR